MMYFCARLLSSFAAAMSRVTAMLIVPCHCDWQGYHDMTKNSLVPVPVRLPISELDVKRAIDQVKAWSSAANHNLEPKYNRAWVQATVEKRLWVNLWENNLDPILRAIELAEKGGDEIFDAALRRVHVEMQAKVIGGSKIPDRQGYQQVWLYGSRAMLRGDFHKRQQRL